MSMLDHLTDDEVSDLQKKAMCLELAQIYNAERSILDEELRRQGVTISADDLRTMARAKLAISPVTHPIDGEV